MRFEFLKSYPCYVYGRFASVMGGPYGFLWQAADGTLGPYRSARIAGVISLMSDLSPYAVGAGSLPKDTDLNALLLWLLRTRVPFGDPSFLIGQEGLYAVLSCDREVCADSVEAPPWFPNADPDDLLQILSVLAT